VGKRIWEGQTSQQGLCSLIKWDWISIKLRLWRTFLWFLSGDIPDLSCFFSLFCQIVLMNGQELNVCSLLTLNIGCSDSVADVACAQLAARPDSLSQGWNPGWHCWVFCLSAAGVLPCACRPGFPLRTGNGRWQSPWSNGLCPSLPARFCTGCVQGEEAEWARGVPALPFKWCCRGRRKHFYF